MQNLSTLMWLFFLVHTGPLKRSLPCRHQPPLSAGHNTPPHNHTVLTPHQGIISLVMVTSLSNSVQCCYLLQSPPSSPDYLRHTFHAPCVVLAAWWGLRIEQRQQVSMVWGRQKAGNIPVEGSRILLEEVSWWLCQLEQVVKDSSIVHEEVIDYCKPLTLLMSSLDEH